MSELLEYLLRSTLKSWERRIIKLEERMSAVDDKIALIDTATNDIATELDALRGEVAGLDTTTAAKLDPIIARLQGLAADPNNPVPDPGTGPVTP